ncbi:PKD domain-containing protein [Spartinivicinus ruber]|uniref:PKD domain-containing protein n=1 Tax=Spartinivicinus ruber TaxID=2683272 RepID=UPI001CA441C6|nr:PKD domain-containing protein [Spartinivicinus ruber]
MMTPKFAKTLLYSACVMVLTGCPGDDDNKPKPSKNKKPVAKFTHSCDELSCSFDAKGSSDPDGTITKYSWNFGDSMNGEGPMATHTYTKAGSYTISLTVTDNKNATAEHKVEVNVTTKPDNPDDDDDDDNDDPVGMNECENWQSNHPEWLWCDDFETTASLTEKYGKNSVKPGKDADSLQRVESDPAHGKFALRLKADSESKNSGSFRRNFGRVPYNNSVDDLGAKPYFDEKVNEVYYRFYVKYPENTQGWPANITRAFGIAAGADQFGPQSFIATLSHDKANATVVSGEPKLNAYSGFDPNNPDSTLKTIKWDDMDNLTQLGDSNDPLPPVPPPPTPPEKPSFSKFAVSQDDGDDDIPPPPPPPGDPEPPVPPDNPDGDDKNPLAKGKWHCVIVHLKLNSTAPYKADGLYEIAIDGKPYSKYTLSDLNWTGKWREYAINGIQFENNWAMMGQNNREPVTNNLVSTDVQTTEEVMESYLDALVISRKPVNCLDTNNPDDPTPPPEPPNDPDKPDDGDDDTPPDIPPPPPPGDPDTPDDDGDNPEPPPPTPDDGDDDGDLPDDIPPPPPPPTDSVSL